MHFGVSRLGTRLWRGSISLAGVVSVACLLSLATAVGSGHSSHAATMTFNGFGTPTGVTPTTHTENGLTMSTTTGHFDIYGNILGGTPVDNVAAIHRGNGGEQVIFTYVGGAFDLLSIDITGWLIRGGEGAMPGTFNASSGATHTVFAPATGVVNFALMSGWSNIAWFTFTVPFGVGSCSDTCSLAAFDDVTFQAPVPIPAALPLFASGLGAIGLLAWRRKRNVAAKIVT